MDEFHGSFPSIVCICMAHDIHTYTHTQILKSDVLKFYLIPYQRDENARVYVVRTLYV